MDGAERLAADLVKNLRKRKERLVLDLERLVQTESEALERMAEELRTYADRVSILAPLAG